MKVKKKRLRKGSATLLSYAFENSLQRDVVQTQFRDLRLQTLIHGKKRGHWCGLFGQSLEGDRTEGGGMPVSRDLCGTDRILCMFGVRRKKGRQCHETKPKL